MNSSPAVPRAGHTVIYAHHAVEARLPAFAVASLEAFLRVADRVVLVAAGSADAALPASLAQRVDVVRRPNAGWDFASFRDGIRSLPGRDLRMLTLCNDSVYGPLFSLAPVYERMMARSAADAWGLTASHELRWHLQSYFLCFGPRVLESAVFRDFWAAVDERHGRRDVIRRGEVGLSQQLAAAGFTLEAYCSAPASPTALPKGEIARRVASALRHRWKDPDLYRDLYAVATGRARLGRNPSREDWPRLVREAGLPFVKRRELADRSRFVELRACVAAWPDPVEDGVLEAMEKAIGAGDRGPRA